MDEIEQARQDRAAALRLWLNRLYEYCCRLVAGINQQIAQYQNLPEFQLNSAPAQEARRMVFKNGKVSCNLDGGSDEIVIEKDCRFYGELRAGKVTVYGHFEGSVVAEEFHCFGSAYGTDACCAKLSVYKGAVLDGEFSFQPNGLMIENGATVKAFLDPFGIEHSVSVLLDARQAETQPMAGEERPAVDDAEDDNHSSLAPMAQDEQDALQEVFDSVERSRAAKS